MSQFQATLECAQALDRADRLSSYRDQFLFPQHHGKDVHYFCGNSLGLQPKGVKQLMDMELEDWGKYGVEGHFDARLPWFSYHHFFTERLAHVVGAKPGEVVAMNTLTVNLHLLMMSFYRPTKGRYKILMEAGAFPSDQYAVETQVRMHGFDPMEAIIEISPREGCYIIEEQDVIEAIEKAGAELALVMIGGVNYYTGQFFDLAQITASAHGVGAYAGYDLAHAVGNIPLRLHDWQVDFACWCSYKYLNSGPGAVGGVFVNEKFGNDPSIFRLAGWWGNDEKQRFKMLKGFEPQAGAAGWQMSNAPVFNMVALNVSLSLFESAGIGQLREKSKTLTDYLFFLLKSVGSFSFKVITPEEFSRRGCQVSMLFDDNGKKVFNRLAENGVVADWREPNVIRVAPVPLYNSFEDVYWLYYYLNSAIN